MRVAGVINRPLLLFMLHTAVYHVGFFGIPDVLLNFYFVSLGYSPELIGLLQSLPRIGGLLTGLPIGLYADRIGARRIIALSTLGLAASSFMLALVPSLALLAISRFLIGMFYGAGQIALAPFMTSLAQQRDQTRLYAYHNIVSMGTAALGSFIGGYLPGWMAALFPSAVADSATPEQTAFAYGAGLAFGALLILISLLPLLGLRDLDLPVPPQPALARQPWRSLPWRKLLRFGFPLLLFGFSGGLTFPFYNLFFRSTFQLSDETVGTILSLGWVGMALVPMLNPLLEQHVGRARALGAMLSIAALAFFALSIAPTLILGVSAYLIAIATRNTMQPLFQPLVMAALPGHERALASSIGFVQWNIGWFTATSLSGVWQSAYGFDFIMQVVGACVFINALTILFIFRADERGTPTHEPAH